MALFRKFFFKKPPDGLLLITDNIYVFDHCFSMKVLEGDYFEAHIRGIAAHLLENFHDYSFMISNFGTQKEESQIYHILSEYGMTVLDYPGHYEGCPLLTMEMIHCILKSSESWLSLGQHNILIMHCEQGCWPFLAFMLSALLIYLGHYSDEKKTLDMLYKQSPLELLEMFSPLNPMPSQMRYLRYISTRNVMPEWPPADRALALDCVILRMVPNFHGQGGFRPIFRIYGPDALMPLDQTPKVLFSTPKNSNLVRFYSLADEVVKIDLHCHVQGDVVLECINLYDDLDREDMVFRIMFNTAFIRSNILMLNRDQIDTLWHAKDQFPKDFRAEVIFSDMDTTTSHDTTEPVSHQEKQGLGIEEFAKVLDIFSHLDWLDAKRDTAVDLSQGKTLDISQENADASSPDEPETFFDTQEELDFDNLSGEINSSAFVLKLQNNLGMLDLGSTDLKQGSLHSTSKRGTSKPQTITSVPSRTRAPSELSPSKVKMPRISASSVELSSSTVIPQLPSSPVQPQRLNSDSAVPIPPEKLTENSAPQTPVNKLASTASLIPLCTPPPLPPPPPTVSLVPVSYTSPVNTSASVTSVSLRSTMHSPSSPPEPSVSPQSSVRTEELVTSKEPSYEILEKLPADSSPTLSSPASSLSTEKESSNTRASLPPVALSAMDLTSDSKHLVTPVTKSDPTSVSPPPPPPPPPPLPLKPVAVLLPLSYGEKVTITKERVAPPRPPPPPPLPPPPSLLPATSSFIASTIPAPQNRDRPTLPEPPPQTPTLGKPSFSPPQPPPPPPPPLPNNPKVLSSQAQSVDKNVRSTSKYILPLTPNISQTIPGPQTPPSPPPPPPPSQHSSSVSSFPSTNKNHAIATPRSPPPPPPLYTRSTRATVPPPAPPLPPPKLAGDKNVSQKPSAPPAPTLPPPKLAGDKNVPQSQKLSGTVPPPPPPGPPPKGSSNSLPSKGSVVGSTPPPPPTFSFGAKERSTARSRSPRGLRANQSSKRTPLKPLHWVKVSRAVQGTLWAETQKPDEASRTPEIDMSELESLFSVSMPNMEAKRPRQRPSVAAKQEKVHLIDLQRSKNCEIMLRNIKMPLPDLMGSVLALDDSIVDGDQVDHLIKFCPTKEEMELLKALHFSGLYRQHRESWEM